MTSISAFAQQTTSLWDHMGKTGQFLAALAVGAALAIVSWQAGVLDTEVFGGLSGAAVDAGSPGSLVAIGAAFVIGATMIVLPCGYPSVFIMPSVLGSRKGLSQRAVLSLLFLSASALPLAAVGFGLGFGGDAVLGLLDEMSAKMTFAVVLYSALGVLAIGYALSELGVFHLPTLFSRVTGPGLPDQDKPYRRAVVLGSTFGAGLGIGCPMPQYYIILGWAVAAANPLYGAILLGAYGLGRVLPAVGIGALITAGVDRRKVSQGMTSLRERTSGFTNAVLAATGAYLIVLFGGVVLYRVVAL